MGLKAKNLTFCYPGHSPILKNFEITVADGETVSVIGRNATGKSTILRLLAGLEKPAESDVSDANVKVTTGTGGNEIFSFTWKHLRKYTSLVFQHYEKVIFDWQTVRSALKWVLDSDEPDHAEHYDKVCKLFESVLPLHGSAPEKYWRQLSGGQQQALALARALLRDPDILLLDEPFVSFDMALRMKFQETLIHGSGTIGKKHRSVVLVTHDIDEAIFLSNQILIVDRANDRSPLRPVVQIPCKTPLGERGGGDYRNSEEFYSIRSNILDAFRKSAKND